MGVNGKSFMEKSNTSLRHCLLLFHLFVGVLCLVIVMVFGTLSPSSFAITLMGKRELLALL